jgi:hypothetical protein
LRPRGSSDRSTVRFIERSDGPETQGALVGAADLLIALELFA